MRRFISLPFVLLCVCLSFTIAGFSQSDPGQSDPGKRDPNQNQPPPRSDRDKEAGESSSRDSRIDLSPPPNDAKDHPNSSVPQPDAGEDASDVQDFHPYDPHRASKDIEVGDFYFRKKNYRAALDRYREALFYKNNDALANFRMAQSFDKLNQSDDAIQHYQEYLKILPNGPLAEEAKKALEKLHASPASQAQQ